jgi:adenine-specific DNA-methyltransferase
VWRFFCDAERVNNPPVGLVHADNDPDLAVGRKQYAYDPHLDPQATMPERPG